MASKFIPFSLPDIGNEEIEEVVNTLRSGWLSSGPKTKIFEENFSGYFNSPEIQSIAVNSATAGLHLVLEALCVSEGDEVIVPSLTFTATAEVVRYLGADVVFVDVDVKTLNIDINAIRKVINPKTKVIILVHYAGLSCDMDAIFSLAKEYGIKVVEDAAHAFPSTYKKNLIGTLSSDATVFSFYANKTMTTGEGGMVVTKNAEIANRVRIMRIHGINRDAFDRFVSKKPAWYYEVVAPGYKYNLTDIASAIGIHQLRKIDKFLEKRQRLASRYFAELNKLPIILPSDAPPGDIHSWHLYVIRLKKEAKINRDKLILELSNKGIGTSVHYMPLHKQPYWKNTYKLKPEDFLVAETAYSAMVSIPLYTKMTDEDQSRVIEALTHALC